MNPSKILLSALGAATLALPAGSAAQDYARADGRGAYEPGYDDRQNFAGYPEFRSFEMRILEKIDEAVDREAIEQKDAQDLMGQLRDIQDEEARAFRFYGWELPVEDRYDIRSALNRLDRSVDETYSP
jgi:hypothetical protein